MKQTKSNSWRIVALVMAVALACTTAIAQTEPLSCGAHSRGLWQHSSPADHDGVVLFNSDLTGNLALVNGLNLVNGDGSAAVFTTQAQFASWLQGAGGPNMAQILSAQLAAMALNVANADVFADDDLFVTGNAMVAADNAPAGCTVSGLVDGLITVSDLMAAADASLLANPLVPGGHPARACQEFLKDALTGANENQNFVDCGGSASWPLEGRKFYDINRDGIKDENEPGISGWQIRGVGDSPMIEPAVGTADYVIGSSTRFSTVVGTDGDGKFEFAKMTVGGTYGVCEIFPVNPANRAWVATARAEWPLHSNRGATYETQIFCPRHVGDTETENEELNANACLDQEGATLVISTPAGDVNIVPGRGPVDFGNVCVATNAGKTLGFWSNKNGQSFINGSDLSLLSSLNLRNANGSNFDPGSYGQFRTWILKADASNMAYMLSAQLAAMALNVTNGDFVEGDSYMHIGDAPEGCTVGGLEDGFITVNALMAAADASLGSFGSTPSGHEQRGCQEFMKNALDAGNNNADGIWVQPAGSCAITYAEDADCSTADLEAIEEGVAAGIAPFPVED